MAKGEVEDILEKQKREAPEIRKWGRYAVSTAHKIMWR